jgi:hypothetical protein
MAATRAQALLFPPEELAPQVSDAGSSTFTNNMKLPVHRWFRYSAGFSAQWVESVLRDSLPQGPVRVFDPFAGSATTLIACEKLGIECWGIDSHPFVARIARAKLQWRSDVAAYKRKIEQMRELAAQIKPDISGYPPLIQKCYDKKSLAELDVLRRACEKVQDGSPAAELAWLTLTAILRKVSVAGTAQWQYILPKKRKRSPMAAHRAFAECYEMICEDMAFGEAATGPRAHFLEADARTCQGVPDKAATLVITSPPYPNNYDYADATRLELSFFGEITGWGCLQNKIRKHLIRSCTQHVPEAAVNLEEVLSSPELWPIKDELSDVCEKLGKVRLTKGGKKTYHLMVACYFRDLALSWKALRRVCDSPCKVCFVIGDSAPYGIYVPVVPWMGSLAMAAGFKSYEFEKTRDRNIKWKNRKHRVPLLEGRLWVKG